MISKKRSTLQVTTYTHTVVHVTGYMYLCVYESVLLSAATAVAANYAVCVCKLRRRDLYITLCSHCDCIYT